MGFLLLHTFANTWCGQFFLKRKPFTWEHCWSSFWFSNTFTWWLIKLDTFSYLLAILIPCFMKFKSLLTFYWLSSIKKEVRVIFPYLPYISWRYCKYFLLIYDLSLYLFIPSPPARFGSHLFVFRLYHSVSELLFLFTCFVSWIPLLSDHTAFVILCHSLSFCVLAIWK